MRDPNDWTQDEIDADMAEAEADGTCEHGNSIEACALCVMPGEECGRWRDGSLDPSCMKAGTEECDFECTYRNSLKF